MATTKPLKNIVRMADDSLSNISRNWDNEYAPNTSEDLTLLLPGYEVLQGNTSISGNSSASFTFLQTWLSGYDFLFVETYFSSTSYMAQLTIPIACLFYATSESTAITMSYGASMHLIKIYRSGNIIYIKNATSNTAYVKVYGVRL